MKFAGLMLVLLLAPGTVLGGEPAPRNVLLIAIDTLRADHMSAYGYDRPTTPRLAAFARQSLVFDNALSPSGWTRASVASFFTGLYPSVHGAESKESILDQAHHTLAERFRERGYATHGIYANYNVAGSLGFDQGFDAYVHPPMNAGYEGQKQISDAAEVNRFALEWLRERRPARPWFLFLFYMDPHEPYLPHEEHDFGPPGFGDRAWGGRRALRHLDRLKTGRGSAEGRSQVVDLYDGEIAYVDRHVGEVLDTLEREGLDDDTVVIVVADHGEGFWEHRGYRGHGRQPYQHQIRVPLMVRWPGRTTAGERVGRPVNAMDLFGALDEGFDLGGARQCGSLFDLVEDPDRAPPVFVEQAQANVAYRVLLDGTKKRIHWDLTGRKESYDLATNPGEVRTEGMLLDQRRIAAMDELLRAISARNDSLRRTIEFVGGEANLDEKELEGLRALGYAH